MNIINKSNKNYIINGITGNLGVNYLQITPYVNILDSSTLARINRVIFKSEEELRSWIAEYGSLSKGVFEANQTELTDLSNQVNELSKSILGEYDLNYYRYDFTEEYNNKKHSSNSAGKKMIIYLLIYQY